MTEDKTTITDNEAIARFMGFDIVEVDYFGTPEETEWQRKHRKWMDKVELTSIGQYAVKVEEDIWQEWENFDYSNDWSQLMPVWYKFRDLKMDLGLSDYKAYKRYWYELANDIPRKPIADVCKLLAEGIRWYNSTTQNKEQS